MSTATGSGLRAASWLLVCGCLLRIVGVPALAATVSGTGPGLLLIRLCPLALRAVGIAFLSASICRLCIGTLLSAALSLLRSIRVAALLA